MAGERSGVDEIPIVTDGVHAVICHSHFSTQHFLVRGGIPIPLMKINAASGPGRRFNLARSMLAKAPNRKRAPYCRGIGHGADAPERSGLSTVSPITPLHHALSSLPGSAAKVHPGRHLHRCAGTACRSAPVSCGVCDSGRRANAPAASASASWAGSNEQPVKRDRHGAGRVAPSGRRRRSGARSIAGFAGILRGSGHTGSARVRIGPSLRHKQRLLPATHR